MATTYQLEAFTSIKDEVKPLLEQHWEEIAINKDYIKLNPDWKEYARLDAAGALRCYTARKDNELVGYFVVIISKSLHYSDHFFAHNDVIFLHKSARKGVTGYKLLKYATQQVEAEGVTLMVVNTKTHQPFDALLERLEYNHSENLYTKCFRG